MKEIENGLRYQTVKEILAQREDISVVSETLSSRQGKKGVRYDEASIVVAPNEGVIEPNAFPGFVSGLLDIYPSVIRDRTISTFDIFGERHKRPIKVHVFPSREAAQQAIK